MRIVVPDPSLVLLIGASGSGKSTFAARHFRPTEVLSSDGFRAMVSDDEHDQSATDDAFDVLHHVATKRLSARRLTVIDATNVQWQSRATLLALAKAHHVEAVAIVFDLPPRLSRERNAARPNRDLPRHVLQRQRSDLLRSVGRLEVEGFRHVFRLATVQEIDAAEVVRRRG